MGTSMATSKHLEKNPFVYSRIAGGSHSHLQDHSLLNVSIVELRSYLGCFYRLSRCEAGPIGSLSLEDEYRTHSLVPSRLHHTYLHVLQSGTVILRIATSHISLKYFIGSPGIKKAIIPTALPYFQNTFLDSLSSFG